MITIDPYNLLNITADILRHKEVVGFYINVKDKEMKKERGNCNRQKNNRHLSMASSGLLTESSELHGREVSSCGLILLLLQRQKFENGLV